VCCSSITASCWKIRPWAFFDAPKDPRAQAFLRQVL
jgi:hypothetical protein